MPQFGAASKNHLTRLDPRLQNILKEAIEYLNFSIISGYRGKAEQDRLYALGRSQTRYPESKHNTNPSLAVDLAPYFPDPPHIFWNDKEGFIYLAGIIKGIAWVNGIAVRWGGDWNMDNDQRDETFRDYGHFEVLES